MPIDDKQELIDPSTGEEVFPDNDSDINSNDLGIWDKEHFGFTLEYQERVIAAFLQNPELYAKIGGNILPEYFDNINIGKIFKCILEYTKDKDLRAINEDTTNNGNLPDKVALNQMLHRNGDDKGAMPEIVDKIYEHKQLETSDYLFIESTIVPFIRTQMGKKAIMSKINSIDNSEAFSEMVAELTETENIGMYLNDLGVDAYEEKTVLNRISNRQQDNDDIKRIPFHWAEMNKVFGGLGAREIFSFIGNGGSGKSMFLINVGANLLLDKKKVLHISLELSPEMVIQRYDMCLLGCTRAELKSEMFMKNLRDKLRPTLGQLIVKQFPSDVTKPTEIINYMKRLNVAKHFIPDVLIVDYADILSSPTKYNEKRHELGSIYRALRNIGFLYNIPVVTATQSNRDSVKKVQSGGTITEVDIAESYDIHRVLDAAVTINSTPEQRMNGTTMVYVIKNRDGEVGRQILFDVDWSKAFCKERPNGR